MKTLRVLWVAVAVLAGCLPDQPFSVEEAQQRLEITGKSGTRLQVKRSVTKYVTSDGSEYIIKDDPTLYDTKLKTKCSPWPSTTKCWPQPNATIDGFWLGYGTDVVAAKLADSTWGYTGTIFADGTCSKRAIFPTKRGLSKDEIFGYNYTGPPAYGPGPQVPVGTWLSIVTNTAPFCQRFRAVTAADEIYELGPEVMDLPEFTKIESVEVL